MNESSTDLSIDPELNDNHRLKSDAIFGGVVGSSRCEGIVVVQLLHFRDGGILHSFASQEYGLELSLRDRGDVLVVTLSSKKGRGSIGDGDSRDGCISRLFEERKIGRQTWQRRFLLQIHGGCAL